MKKISLLTLLLASAALIITGCSKDKNNNPVSGKNIKYTITVTGATDIDYVSFIFSGGTTNPNDKTIWKIDGVAQENEAAVSLTEDDFGAGKTIVVESTKGLYMAHARAQCLQPSNDSRTYKISYKAEVNGKVVRDDANVSVGYNSDYTHMFDY